ncbi:hypothetical protein MYX84_11295 [Acidobacteria bacterium AH-259-O06]|nr:hypothetical protein [Acidobacteria bacterium AH-259-O06]
MTSETESFLADTVFLLGAGASTVASVPALGDLKKLVVGSLAQRLPALAEKFSIVNDHLRNKLWEEEEPDIEQILHVIDGLLLANLELGAVGLRDLAVLEYEIRRSIWAALKDHGELHNLEPFKRFVGKAGLDVFSLNNDVVIEDWCDYTGIPVFAGFDQQGYWMPDGYETAKGSLRLYKLHGSVDWTYRLGTRLRRINLHAITEKPDGTKVLRSPVGDLSLVFPSQNKVIADGPLLGLHVRFRERLRKARVLVVVGCRLGDEHIFRAIHDNLVGNESLRVVIVSPHAFETVDRLAFRKAPSRIKSRIDALPLPFEDALKGSLFEFCKLVAGSKISLAGSIRRAIFDLPAPEAVENCTNFADILQSGKCTDSQSEVEILIKVLDDCSRLHNLEWPRQRYQKILGDVAGSGPADLFCLGLADALRRARRECESSFFYSCIGIAVEDSRLYALGGSPQRVCWIKEDWTFKAIGPRLRDAYGLEVVGNKAFVIERRRLGIEGLGSLRCIDLETGRSSYICPRLTDLAWRSFRDLWRRKRGISTSQETQIGGYLSYPTAVHKLDSSRLLVVESRRIVVVSSRIGGAERYSEATFMNLADCTVLDNENVLLLEGGTQGHGRILRLALRDMTQQCLADNVRGVAGIAVDRVREYLLLTIGSERPHGKIVQIPWSSVGGLDLSRKRVVVEDLHVPRYLVQATDTVWYCSTASGPIRFSI